MFWKSQKVPPAAIENEATFSVPAFPATGPPLVTTRVRCSVKLERPVKLNNIELTTCYAAVSAVKPFQQASDRTSQQRKQESETQTGAC